jgi:hypothetical protein
VQGEIQLFTQTTFGFDRTFLAPPLNGIYNTNNNNLSFILLHSPTSSIMLESQRNIMVHILDTSQSGMKETESVTPTYSKKEKCNMIVYLKSETLLTVSRLGKAAIKGTYINMLISQNPFWLSAIVCT